MSAKVVGKITVIKRNGSSGSQFPLTGSQCTFGRNAECEIRIQLPTVSDRECTLSADENGNFILSKMNKVGEVLINDQKVDCDAAVKNNDILTIAGRSFRFEYPPRMKMFGNVVSSSSPNIVGTPKSALIERVKQSQSRRVSFGPQLSPEQFASYLPPDTPVKKGAIPMQSLSNTDEDNKCAGVLSESNRRSSGRRASLKNSKSTKDSTRKTGGKRSFDELVALVGLDKLLPKTPQRKQCSRGKQSTQIQTGASQFTPKEKKTPKRRSKQITPKFNPVDVVSMFSASPEKQKSKSSKYTPTGRDSIVKTAHTPGPECADSRDAFTETQKGEIRSRGQDSRKTSKISEVSLISSKKQTAEKSAAAPVQFNSRSQAEVPRMENADNEPAHQTMDDTVPCESPLSHKDLAPERRSINVKVQTPKALDSVEKEVETSPGADRATLARRQSSVKGRTPKPVGDGPDDPSLDDTVPLYAVTPSLAENRRSSVKVVENTPIGQENVEFIPEEGDKVSREDASTNEKDDTIPFEAEKTEPGAYAIPPQEDATESAYSFESNDALPNDEPPSADQLPTFSDTSRALNLEKNASSGLDDTVAIEEFGAALPKEDCKTPGGRRKSGAGKMPKTATNTPATGGRRSPVHFTTPKAGDHETHEVTKRKGTPVPWRTAESAKKTSARGRKNISGSQESPTTPYARTGTPKPDEKITGLTEVTDQTPVAPSASQMTPKLANKTPAGSVTHISAGKTPKTSTYNPAVRGRRNSMCLVTPKASDYESPLPSKDPTPKRKGSNAKGQTPKAFDPAEIVVEASPGATLARRESSVKGRTPKPAGDGPEDPTLVDTVPLDAVTPSLAKNQRNSIKTVENIPIGQENIEFNPEEGDKVLQEDATTNENDHTIPFEAEKTEADACETPPQEDATESAYSIESDCALPYDEPSTADELPTLSDTSRVKNASLGLDDTVAIGEFGNDLPKEDCKTPAGRRMSGTANTPVAFVNGTPNLSTHRSAGKTPKTSSNTPTTGGRRSSVHLTTPKAGDHEKHEVTKRKGTPVPWKTSDSAKKTPARGRRSFSHSRGLPTTPYTRTPKPDKKIHGVTKVADQTPVNPSASQMTPKSAKKIPTGSIGKTPKTSSCNPEAGGQRSSLCLVTPMASDGESPLPPKALDLVENAAETSPGANRATPARRRSSVKGGTPKHVGDGPEDPSLDDTVPLDAVTPSLAKNRRNSVKGVENTPIGQEDVELNPEEGDKVLQEVAASYESDDTIPFEAEETEADAYETLPQEDTAESAYIIESDDMLPNDKPPSADQLPTFSNTPRVLKLDENVSLDLNDTAHIEEIGAALHKEDSMTPAGERSWTAKTPAASVNGTPNLSTHRSSGKMPKSVTNTPATGWRRSSVNLTTPKADDHEILEVTKRKGTPVSWKTIDQGCANFMICKAASL